jgi:tetratricopeptide (TPR) repeat protein
MWQWYWGSLKVVLGLVFVAILAMPSWAADAITTKTNKVPLQGHIVTASPDKIDFEQKVGINKEVKEIPVSQIITVIYENEPLDLANAKKKAAAGRYSEAVTALERVKDENARDVVKRDVEYYKALCASRLALMGAGDPAEAGRAMKAFLDANPQSFHYYEGVELVGDLLVALKQYPQAIEFYGKLNNAPWPDYKMRAGNAVGRTLLAQGKNDEAIQAFDKVIAAEGSEEAVNTERALAKIGKASVLLAMQKPDEAIQTVEEALRKVDPDDELVQARACNVLGNAYRQTNKSKEALLAFLQVDLLYPDQSDAHAEALANLVELWEQARRPDRAERAKKTLEEKYKGSVWAKKVGI